MLICPNCSTQYPDAARVCPTCRSDLSSPAKTAVPMADVSVTRVMDESASEGTEGYRTTAADDTARFSAGTTLAGRYRIVDAVGRGGMGEVYRAEDLELGGSVALKVLPERVEQDEQELERLLSEVRIARAVSHSNVCRVHDIGIHETEGSGAIYFISMEYIDGEDLSSMLGRSGRLPKAEALAIAKELCAGLAAVHESGLLHRDIKPSNVMIDGKGRVRLADFGLAIIGTEDTSHGGTPAYMAPEQHTTRETTVRSDVYALGLVLYEIFTGERVFEAKTPMGYAWHHLQTEPRPLTSLLQESDPELERIIFACLEKIPERRTAAVATVADALAKINPDGPTLLAEAAEAGEVLRALLLCDLVDSTALVQELGDRRAAELGQRHDRLARDLLARHGGREIDKTDGFLLLFERPIQALRFALEYHQSLASLSKEEGHELSARVGVHFGELWLRENPAEDVARGAKPIEAEGLAKAVAARLMSIAGGGQTLLSRSAFDLSRRAAVGLEGAEDLCWLDHGAWRLKGVADPIDVYEVGRVGVAPLAAPAESEKVRRLVMQPRVEGWRPAPGLAVPGRRNWRLEQRLGEGGFGEVWLTRNTKTGERRGFKFCFDTERLQALQREITLFRLLKEVLGEREDINRILDWNLDEAPYFIESEYTSAGSLEEWVESEGGVEAIPMEKRLEIGAQVATALAAAHSAGVLHKDVKPSNILIQRSDDGGIQAQLADFGIGQVTEAERLAAVGITIMGTTEETADSVSTTTAGTRLYMAPELLEGRPPTLQADIYALGILLYQLVVGDLKRALASGWRRDIDDDLLAEDIASFVDRSPERRPASAQEVAERLRTLEDRRQEHQAEIAAREAAAAAREAFELSQRRRKMYQAVAATAVVALVVVSVLAMWAIRASQKERLARESTETILDFMVGLFEITDPFLAEGPDEKRGETITAREILDRGAARADDELADQPLLQARLLDTFGDIYRSLGLYDTAEPLLERSLEIRREKLGDHPDLATSLYHKAQLLMNQGSYAEAVPVQEEALALRESHFGADHDETIKSMHDLALTLRMAGELDRALELFAETVAASERVRGPEHEKTAASMSEMASTLRGLGKYAEARPVCEQALAIQEKVLGADHPKTLVTLDHLATILFHLGDYSEALETYQRALELMEPALGAEHPHTLSLRGNLAATFTKLGDPERATAAYEQIIETQERVLGAEHPDTLLNRAKLAASLVGSGQYGRARETYERILEIQRSSLGVDHIRTLLMQNNLSATLTYLGEYGRARQITEQTLEAQERVLGNDHPHTLVTRLNLASALANHFGEYSEARELCRQALEAQEEAVGSEHPNTLWMQARLASILSALGHSDEARQLLEGSLEIQERVLGAEHPFTQVSSSYLAATLADLGELERAEALQERVLETQERTRGERHFHTLSSMTALGRIYARAGKLDRARAIQERALRVHEQALGTEHPLTLDAMSHLAGTLWQVGEAEGAEELARTAWEKQNAVFGPEHFYTTRSAKRLLEIAVHGGDSAAIARGSDRLRWLVEREEDRLDAAELREVRGYVLEVMAGLGG